MNNIKSLIEFLVKEEISFYYEQSNNEIEIKIKLENGIFNILG